MSRVFIVLATWEAPAALLDRQIASLSAQTFGDWSGVVVDDSSGEAARRGTAERVAREPRLRFVEQRERVGFYRNFERGLAMAPKDCDYVALCDQDDRWAPHKLERQVGALDAQPEAQLCYTDLRLMDVAGTVLAGSFWQKRPHGRSFREIFYNNVVTGATALVRRRLLDIALSFPDDPGGAFHDHWLALCAMASGGLVYLDEPLVDYTQHAGNVLGAQGLEHTGRGAVGRLLGGAVTRPRGLAARLDALATHATRADSRLRSFASALRTRFDRLPPDASAALRPFLRSSRAARLVDLFVPTLMSSLVAGEETNLEPLKISLGLAWATLRGKY
jgi:glycosyltransferase involved in cell wall biosynthesis